MLTIMAEGRLKVSHLLKPDAKGAYGLTELMAEVMLYPDPDPDVCRCGHPKHAGQCPAADGCWCDTFTPEAG